MREAQKGPSLMSNPEDEQTARPLPIAIEHQIARLSKKVNHEIHSRQEAWEGGCE